MTWPKALIHELADRRCIVFLGAGASAACENGGKRPPSWSDLLQGLQSISHSEDACAISQDLINKEKYLDAAEVLIHSIHQADFANYMRERLSAPRFAPSKIHEVVYRLDPKIVVTTNYDEIYDNYCRTDSGLTLFNVCKYYETHLVSDLKSSVRQIIKVHGCLSNPNKIVLSRSQFFQARQEHPNFYKVLDALFLTNTVLFIGYSLNDPDIQLILENSNIAYPSSHPHYALVETGMDPSLKAVIRKTYNIECLEFTSNDYDEAQEKLNELDESVTKLRMENPA